MCTCICVKVSEYVTEAAREWPDYEDDQRSG
jgi:hypothetical protein